MEYIDILTSISNNIRGINMEQTRRGRVFGFIRFVACLRTISYPNGFTTVKRSCLKRNIGDSVRGNEKRFYACLKLLVENCTELKEPLLLLWFWRKEHFAFVMSKAGARRESKLLPSNTSHLIERFAYTSQRFSGLTPTRKKNKAQSSLLPSFLV